MLVPALVYFSFNTQDEIFRNGWAIPMATDIAFALGILAMLGKRVPIGLKVFLTALAIVDDLGAVLSIAAFYTDSIQPTWLLIALGVFLVMMLLNYLGVRKVWVFLFFGLVGIWYPLLMSGVHATIAGILIAFTIPARRKISSGVFGRRLETEINRYRKYNESVDRREMSHEQIESIQTMKNVCEAAASPLLRIEHHLKPFALFVVMPIFAIANTGVILNFSDIGGIVQHPIFIGISSGLLLGKSLGIFGFSWLAIKLKLVQLPEGVKMGQLFGVALLAGIGFTMSLFITDLAFHGDQLQIIAKKAIFFSSILAGVLGFIWLKLSSK